MKDLKMVNILARHMRHEVVDGAGNPVEPDTVVAVVPEHVMDSLTELTNYYRALMEMMTPVLHSNYLDRYHIFKNSLDISVKDFVTVAGITSVELTVPNENIDERYLQIAGAQLAAFMMSTISSIIMDDVYDKKEPFIMVTLESSKGPILFSGRLTEEGEREEILEELPKVLENMETIFNGDLSE